MRRLFADLAVNSSLRPQKLNLRNRNGMGRIMHIGRAPVLPKLPIHQICRRGHHTQAHVSLPIKRFFVKVAHYVHFGHKVAQETALRYQLPSWKCQQD